MEFIIVTFIVAGALGFLVRRIWRWMSGNGGGSCCSKGCPVVTPVSRRK